MNIMIEYITQVYSDNGKMLLHLNNYKFYKDRITQAGVEWMYTSKS